MLKASHCESWLRLSGDNGFHSRREGQGTGSCAREAGSHPRAFGFDLNELIFKVPPG